MQNDFKSPTLYWWALYHIFSPKWLDCQKWRKFSNPSLMSALLRFYKMSQTVQPFICWCSITFFKTIRFSKWRKLSDPSFMGASSSFCKMTQTVRSFIYGCLRRFVLKPWWSANEWRVRRFVSFCKSVNFIELYWEIKFTWNSWSWITLWNKILRPRKK